MNITDLIEEQTKDFTEQMELVIAKLEKQIDDIILKLRMRDGFLLVDQKNYRKVIEISGDLAKALEDSGYYELAERTLKANNKILAKQHEALKDLLGRERLGQIDKTTIQALNAMKFDGMTNLADDTLNAIKNALYDGVNLGLPMSKIREQLGKQLGKLSQYTETYIRTAKREFSQKVENITAQKIGFGKDKDDIWEYSPAILQKNSHAECIWAVKKQYFTDEEKQDFEAGILPTGMNRSAVRYNCVHRFQITNKTYKEAFGG